MAQKRKIEVEFQVADPHADRVLTQEVTYLAKPGKNITEAKIATLDEVQRNVVGVVSKALGLEMLDVKSTRE